uniref:4Fe-4S ferredoxin-type domain-containing protein n=1 Tax=Manihot esculenta TaxID=3983 RepID=A0A2C9W752_MANES
MRLLNGLVAILLILVLSFFSRGDCAVEQNLTTGTSSLSPWLKKVAIYHHHHPHPHPHPRRHPRPLGGCRSQPWICRERNPRPNARMMCCRNKCVDVSSDVNNCGFCGITCPFSWLCCRGFCIDVNISPFHCGSCRNRCPWGVRCDNGVAGNGTNPSS